MSKIYRICTRCIMDTTDPEISFDSSGVCVHCNRYDIELPKRVFSGSEAKYKLSRLVKNIIKSGRNKEYDCIIGISGGVDSTYVAYVVKSLGLRPLAIHFDNGWNSELSVSNMEKIIDKLDIDLYTFVMDWNEFKELQLSFLKSSTPDGEVPTDHAISALLFREASKRGIKYIINGMNFATESVSVRMWSYGHSDWHYIKSVHKLFSNKKLKSFPHFSFWNLFFWTAIKQIESVSILNYIDYDKASIMQLLKDELGWVYYGGKHYESVYTRFYQGYILPKKFNVDKRIGHLSDLIRSGQISRDVALKLLNENGYSEEMQLLDYNFVLKKLDLNEETFEEIMTSRPKSFLEYENRFEMVSRLKRVVNYLRKRGFYSK